MRTGQLSRFTNGRDPNPRAREAFSLHRLETLIGWIRAPQLFRSDVSSLPHLNLAGLSRCQVTTITEVKASLKANRPVSLVQMVLGSGKTFAAVMQVYRLLKHARARRALCFLSISATLVSRCS